MKNLIEEKIVRKKITLTWTEPELIELNAHLRDIGEGYCSIGNDVTLPPCTGGIVDYPEDCDGGSAHVGG